MCSACYERQRLAEDPEKYRRRLEWTRRYRAERLRSDPEYAERVRAYDRAQDAREKGRVIVGGPRISMADKACAICGTTPCVAKNLCRRCYSRVRMQQRRAAHPELSKAESARNTDRARRNYEAIRKAKDVPCTDCANRFPVECMDLDHVPGRGKKLFRLNSAGPRRLESVLAEIAKCDPVCANCHRIRTRRRARGETLGETA